MVQNYKKWRVFMSTDHIKMWQDLGLDLERHEEFLSALPGLYGELFMKQENRPQAMDYFNFVVSEAHGLRIKEIVEHRQKGGRVVAGFCVYVPDEIILAAGGVSIGLCAGAQFPVASGEKVLPRNMCPLIKSTVGFKLERICPYFQAADFVVGETTCDGKKKAWEILNDFIPTYVMELPQRKDKVDLELWRSEIIRFKDKMEQEAGVSITFEKLAEAIKLVNRKRAVLQRLYRTRQADPVPISGKDALLVTQLAFFDDPSRFIEKTSILCEQLEARVAKGEGVVKPGTPRLMLAGTPMPLPHWKLHHIIESSGGVVVCEESCTGTRYFETLVCEEGSTVDEQLANIAHKGLKINCSCFTPNNERIEDIIRLAREYKVDGVVYNILQFCQPYGIEYYRVEKALQKEGIPVIKIETDFSEEDTGQLKTRLEAFMEMVGK